MAAEESKDNGYELTYFGVPGRAEQTRLVFAVAGQDLKDTRVTGAQWGAMKKSGATPYGQLPLLKKTDGSFLAQSNAIANFAAATFGLMPKTADGFAALGEFRGIATDGGKKVSPTMRMKGAEKLAARKKFAEEDLPKLAAFFEAAAKKYIGDGGFVEGDSPTLADIVLYNSIGMFSSGWLDGVPADSLAKYETLMKFRDTMRTFPAIAKYLAREENQGNVRQVGWNAQAPKPEETYEVMYFPARGRCEQLRLALAAGGATWKNQVQWNGKPISFPVFAEIKKTDELPWKSLPLLKVTKDGNTKTIAQTAAILQYIGAKLGLTLDDVEGQAEVLGWIGAVEDLRIGGYKAMKMFGGTPESAKKFRDVLVPRWLGSYEKNFKGPFCTGDKLTVADCTLFDLLENVNGLVKGSVLDGKYEKLKKFMSETFPANENVAAYLKTERFSGSSELSYE